MFEENFQFEFNLQQLMCRNAQFWSSCVIALLKKFESSGTACENTFKANKTQKK